eukprot:CAMPEP_0174369116 /NCGR_PEP_ID=MMETSP0811_2-20130205/91390_1 /TAXON_ID=73025 ORGANISM="Eutreptiella gymnastica-like, Strain CCMP1594" /NCGR_SAMPLE_ID=MMETSP0811_2 /ASSEMBLY_ACC=CAM_ASM_000667 /LENGTH=87 /DNA_ID=CAMNT_0015513239 /DNA_START=48 /DNA_END=307 /DNA_ORIENTATION=-
MAVAHENLGNPEKALELYERIIQLEPTGNIPVKRNIMRLKRCLSPSTDANVADDEPEVESPKITGDAIGKAIESVDSQLGRVQVSTT